MAGAICGKGPALRFDGVCVVQIVLFASIVCMFVFSFVFLAMCLYFYI